MTSLTELVAAWIDGWNADLERLVFGRNDPADIAGAIERFVAEHVGPTESAVFYGGCAGIVAGLRLVDGREVVVKAHRWQVSVDRLRAIHEVQAHLADCGLPAPRPMVGPERFGGAIATVEELRGGDRAPGHDPSIRRVLAEGLHAFVTVARPLTTARVGAPAILYPPGESLWPEPHSIRFDFTRTAQGAEWIDALATQARGRLRAARDERVIGHFDWRVENLPFRGGEITAIYDWDSVAADAEAVVVGNTAALFTADWTVGERDPLPSLEEMRVFVEDYERARGKSFTRGERELLDAANLMVCAYGARCQHSDIALYPDVGGTPTAGWQRLLRERGERGLA